MLAREGGDHSSPEYAILFDSTSGMAFGPIISDLEHEEGPWEWCLEVAEAFIKWAPHDLRGCTDYDTAWGGECSGVAGHYSDFLDAVNTGKVSISALVEGGLE